MKTTTLMQKSKRKPIIIWLAGLLVTIGVIALSSPAAHALPLGFTCITNNNSADCATGVAQLSVDVTDPGGGQVLFTFSNSGSYAASITDVYFDDGSLFGIAQIINDVGVSFTQDSISSVAPPELPGAHSILPVFETTEHFLADSDPPVQPNGVNPGESLGIKFDLISGQDFQDTINALNNGSLRIGIHVQGFANGGSESFVNKPPSQVPEPTTFLLLGSGLLGLGLLGRKIKR